VPFKNLILEHEAETAIVTLNRPDSRNALSLELMLELLDCLDQVDQDRSVRAVILAAAGKVFCAGHDLREMTHRLEDEYRHLFAVCTELMTRIQSIHQPVIAEVQGIATAAGCQLVASCDLAVASERACFATPGVRIGLFCTTPMVALSRSIGRKRAAHMLLTGQSIDAFTAEEWGLVNYVIPETELRTRARELAACIARASPLIVDIGKQAYYSQIERDQATAYEYAREVMTKNAMCDDAQEGIAAFLEKRRPSWSGK